MPEHNPKEFHPEHLYRAEMWGAVAGTELLVLLTKPGGLPRPLAKGTELFFVKQAVETVWGRVAAVESDKPGMYFIGRKVRPE